MRYCNNFFFLTKDIIVGRINNNNNMFRLKNKIMNKIVVKSYTLLDNFKFIASNQ